MIPRRSWCDSHARIALRKCVSCRWRLRASVADRTRIEDDWQCYDEAGRTEPHHSYEEGTSFYDVH